MKSNLFSKWLMLTVGFFLLMVILSLLSGIANSCITTYPIDGSVGVPNGYTEISAYNSVGTGFTVNPIISGNTYQTTNTFLSYYWDSDLHKNVYYPVSSCLSLVYKPLQDYIPNADYQAQVTGSEVFTFSTNHLFSVGETVVKQTANYMRHKPVSAICPQGSVTVWQDKDLGVIAQRSDLNSNKIGPEIVVTANAKFYSRDIGPSVAMNTSCQFVIAFMKDWNYWNIEHMDLYVKKYNWNGTLLVTSYINKVWPDYVRQHKDSYQMQYDVSSPSVGIDSAGNYVVSFIMPKCFDRGCDMCKVGQYQCDNYVMAWKYSADGTVITKLGDTKNTDGNVWTPYGPSFIIVNKIPFMSSNYITRDLSAGCFNQGSAYDCPYHSHVSMSDSNIVVTWIEGEGNMGGDNAAGGGWSNAFKDDPLIRVFTNAGVAVTAEKPMATTQGTKGFDHWAVSSSVNNSGQIVGSWVEKYRPNSTLKQQTDVIGRFMNPDGTWRGDEFVVNEDRNYEQYNPGVTINDRNEVMYGWLSYGTHCGGLGVYAKMFDFNTGNGLTNQFRVNTFNDIIVDVEEDNNVNQSIYTWSFNTSLSSNSFGDFIVTYQYPNRMFLNSASKAGIVASYGEGNQIRSNLFINP